MSRATNKRYYHLIAGQIVFLNPENQDNGAVSLNAIVQTRDGNIGRHQLNQAQQSLQLHFFKNVGDEKIQIIDVVLMSISSLGYMTEEQFLRVPEGAQLKEAAPDDPFAAAIAANTTE